MNPVLWLDNKLLELTRKFMKKFNWLTGKDNFWLAYKIAFLVAFFAGFLIVKLGDGRGLALAVGIFTSIIFLSCCLMMAHACEGLAHIDMLRGSKDLSIFSALRLLCLYVFINMILIGTMFLFGRCWPTVILFCLFGVIFMFFFYLLSVEKPPLKRSMALIWAKGVWQGLSLKTPVPVPVKTS